MASHVRNDSYLPSVVFQYTSGLAHAYQWASECDAAGGGGDMRMVSWIQRGAARELVTGGRLRASWELCGGTGLGGLG